MSVIVNMGILHRTLHIRYGDQIGSGLYIDIADVRMILTAAHIVKGLIEGERIALRTKLGWEFLDIDDISYCQRGLDVCAIRPKKKLGDGIKEDQLDGGGLKIGEEVSYCGFPLNLELQGFPGDLDLPVGLVKGGICSGSMAGDDGKVTYMLFDTINNRGFSGGPVVRNDGGKLKIVAIVSGYHYDAPLPVLQKLIDGTEHTTDGYFVRPNSGFMKAVPIKAAVDAAKKLVPLNTE